MSSHLIYPTIEDAIGKTPLVALQRMGAADNAKRGNVILGKLEGNNPAGSVKDRPALSMIKRAEERGGQRDGQGGLQLCPGKEMDTQEWTSVVPAEEAITCNIGDMLMRWSDDVLPSNFHRVKSPGVTDYRGARYSLAFFAQANRDVTIEGPAGKYPPITAEDYIDQRVRANFAR